MELHPRRLPSPKKWLSYREQTLLHRPLTPDEAEQFTHHTRRNTALLAENPALDVNYRASVWGNGEKGMPFPLHMPS